MNETTFFSQSKLGYLWELQPIILQELVQIYLLRVKFLMFLVAWRHFEPKTNTPQLVHTPMLLWKLESDMSLSHLVLQSGHCCGRLNFQSSLGFGKNYRIIRYHYEVRMCTVCWHQLKASPKTSNDKYAIAHRREQCTSQPTFGVLLFYKFSVASDLGVFGLV